MHPRVISFSTFNFHESPWRAQPDATNAMARAQVLKFFTLKSHQKQLMLVVGGGEKRGRTKKNSTNESQDLDPKGSPHKEEKVIGGVVDLDLLS